MGTDDLLRRQLAELSAEAARLEAAGLSPDRAERLRAITERIRALQAQVGDSDE